MGTWDAERDRKLDALFQLLDFHQANDKVIVFTQFADTVRYLERELHRRGLDQIAGVSGEHSNPTEIGWKFSPESNESDARLHQIANFAS
ncbi:MAG: hypothetical protein R3C02_21790 [Planctomycetaceae bacterium]